MGEFGEVPFQQSEVVGLDFEEFPIVVGLSDPDSENIVYVTIVQNDMIAKHGKLRHAPM